MFLVALVPLEISIHALREEGDDSTVPRVYLDGLFLSTPSARRATRVYKPVNQSVYISIHALREEGDVHLPFGGFQL